jgi:archaellum component FlaC
MMMSDIEKNMRDIMVLEITVSELEDVVQTQQVSLARIDENIKAIRSAVELMAGRQRQEP